MSSNSRTAGIDSIGIETGDLKLDLVNTFAPEVGDDPEKYSKGLGIKEISLPDTNQDFISMGVNAAIEAMEIGGYTPKDIGRIDFATESSFDRSKPASSYAAGCLEDYFEEEMDGVEYGERKFACISGTQCINNAYDWITSGRHRGKAALVITSDIALYERGDPGEATQGAGAVAMIVSEDPDITRIMREYGIGSSNAFDFHKPQKQFPTVDGEKSVNVYLDRMRKALMEFEDWVGSIHPNDYRLVAFHTPFPGMADKAALLGFRHSIQDTKYEEEFGRRPTHEDYSDEEEYNKAIEKYTKIIKNTNEYQAWYRRCVEPTLKISEHVGNWYTASAHMARLSGLYFESKKDKEMDNMRMLIGSYGSGAQAQVHEEVIKPGFEDKVFALNIEGKLNSRKDITMDEYEEIHDSHNYSKDQKIEPISDASGKYVYSGEGDDGRRLYRYVA